MLRKGGVLLAVLLPGASLQDPRVEFARDVLPILSRRCHECHGTSKQKGGLRLDVRAAAFRGGDSGPAVVPRDPAKSLLLSRVLSRDEEERMPPKGGPLPAAELAVLRRWIEAGAEWPEAAAGDASRVASDHWAFQPVRRPEPPTERPHPVDAFVLARLRKAGLGFSPPADRRTLARRLSLDLVGLPPSPEEVDAFEADAAPDAVERYADRLLASPHYGERWARRWLDLARYADTNGYEKDRDRSIWPWRDWVIRALNDDLPFDRFTIEQIAGDFVGAEIATGFHRNTMTNEEGGIDVEEFRFESVVDRVGTTGTVWLGLTLACAQCHSHKFDPISQREYYGVFALLNNADEPEVPVPDPAIEKRREEIGRQIAALEAAMDERFDEAAYGGWKKETLPKVRRWVALAPASVEARIPVTFDVLPDRSVLASGDNPNNNTYRVGFRDLPGPVRAVRLEVLPHPSLPEGGPGRAPLFSPGDFLLGEISAAQSPFKAAAHSYAENKKSAALAIDGKSDTGWSVKGRIGEAHHAVFAFEKPAEGALDLALAQEYIHQMTIGRFRVSVTVDEGPYESGLPADVEDAFARGDEAAVRRHWTRSVRSAEDRKKIADLRKSMPRAPTTLVMRERRAEHARKTRIHHRGQFLAPREEVQAGIPAVLPPLGASRDRLGFAKWLVDPANPLTPRVIMNRHWQAFFGRGLVATLENFGVQGARPSHPELLDWLASEFVARKWSVKAMHRLIVTSETYRQSSRVTPELVAKDPENVLLGRAPRFRLEAELVRDGALAAAGLLDRRIGGRSVYPPQPEGVTEVAYGQPKWPASQGGDRYRRGLYTFMKRTAPYAAFAAFDAPSGEVCAARRDRSNTPLQALNLLNDAVYQEAALALAKKARSAPDPAAWLFRQVLLRAPTDRERAALVEFRERQKARLAAKELDGSKLGGDPELASWTLAARVVLNLDETITRE